MVVTYLFEAPTFYDFPAEYWTHLRTTNPIESTFTMVRLVGVSAAMKDLTHQRESFA
jgi:transposase-like protein